MKTEIPVITLQTVVVGFGAAALNAADRLHDLGCRDIAIVCEDINQSTSRNTGSDKQTYYKLSLSGQDRDSVRTLAETLYGGRCVDGDIALCEAALSAQCFLKLKELGVPFPTNRYGEFIGYKTDHDPYRRATSAGPLTSKMMVECLERSVRGKGITIHNGYYVVSIIAKNEKYFGLLCLNLQVKDRAEYVLFNCTNIVWATGGPAGMYADSVYPHGHLGSSGIAFEAGVAGKNLTEWQFGLASLHPRWNVSGTFMQALPRFVSSNADGTDEREFLTEYFPNAGVLNTNVFLKGYEWPFDARKAWQSSFIDILVYMETVVRGRQVVLDYSQNPQGLNLLNLSPEAAAYIKNAGADFGTPVERLIHMNRPAYDFYLSRGVDLKTQPLQIALCAQHNNGGLATDCWWQTNVAGFFAVGEVCGSHGVYRPGGSALNAGQVGSMRAAQFIAANRMQPPIGREEFLQIANPVVQKCMELVQNEMQEESNIDELWKKAGRRMSRAGGPVRDLQTIRRAAEEAVYELSNLENAAKIQSPAETKKLFALRDTLIAQVVYLSAMTDYAEQGGKSRGSAIYIRPGSSLTELDSFFTFEQEQPEDQSLIQEVRYAYGKCSFTRRAPRELPPEDDCFENVWKTYLQNQNIY